MPITDDLARHVNQAMESWSQGDVALEPDVGFVHMADLTRAHSPASVRLREIIGHVDVSNEPTMVTDSVFGLVVVTQTCDIVRDCRSRPFVDVVPLVKMNDADLEAIRRSRKPSFVYVPAVAAARHVADLDRIMTIEKAIVANWSRLTGLRDDNERRDFSRALSRKWTRMAFPDDFVQAVSQMKSRWFTKHRKQSPEGAHLRALREIRVAAAPSWHAGAVKTTWWFIWDCQPEGYPPNWSSLTQQWLDLFKDDGRFEIHRGLACGLEDLTARDYVESDKLDLDQVTRRA